MPKLAEPIITHIHCKISYINCIIHNIHIHIYIIQQMSLKSEQQHHPTQHTLSSKIMPTKSFYFHVYYQPTLLQSDGSQSSLSLSKMGFKLEDSFKQKQQSRESVKGYGNFQKKYKDSNYKNVQLGFYNLDDQLEIDNSLHELKTKISLQQYKIKLIFYSSQAKLIQFYQKGKYLNVGVQNIPVCLYTTGLCNDLSQVIGWSKLSLCKLSQISPSSLEPQIRKWIEAPTQKIDLWSVQLQVSEQGRIYEYSQSNQISLKPTTIKTHFLSHLSIGHHAKFLMESQKENKGKKGLCDRFMHRLRGIKRFCCMCFGNKDMRQNTGVIKVDLVDEKGQHELLKYIHKRVQQHEQDSQYLSKPSKRNNPTQTLSLVLSNIDRFHSQKLPQSSTKMNDNKLQLHTFQSQNQSTFIGSFSGQINIQLSPEVPVYVEVGDRGYRLERGIRVTVFGGRDGRDGNGKEGNVRESREVKDGRDRARVRVGVNKQMLCC